MSEESRADELVELMPPQLAGMVRWSPAVRGETLALINHLGLSMESSETLVNEASQVLSKCLPPDGRTGGVTGLVIGYVQSGKTMSFTTVAALARDNNFQLIVIITGTSLPLLHQSTRRLIDDLRLQMRKDHRWQHFESQQLTENDEIAIRGTLADWRDPSVPPSQRKTILITTMKHHGHLDKVIDILEGLSLGGVPSLVIDDEADQASLNNFVGNADQSTTYQKLLAIRGCLPSHSLLQYTATPQAPLLINIIDNLSPDFAELLTPGTEYVGGAEFFINKSPYVEIIPDGETGTATEPLTEPPSSLLRAMQIFLLGVAAGYEKDETGTRSMMVHPSQHVAGHSEYRGWVSEARNLWRQILESTSESDPIRSELLAQFNNAYTDLQVTVPEIAELGALMNRMPFALRNTRVETVNATSGTTPQINWASSYSHILIGGQAMDRGFTVEGLTVTYMPRSVGVGNADTIQQRARFFGYKRSYFGFCRVFLTNSARDAYKSYVSHEIYMRRSLEEYRGTGRPLSDWKRAFFLNSALRPTRKSVLDLEYKRNSFGDDWSIPLAPQDPPNALVKNREVVAQFLESHEWRPVDGSPKRTAMQRHLWLERAPLSLVLEELLTRLRFGRPRDSQVFTGLRIVLEAYIEREPVATCDVYDMSSGERRHRTLDGEGRIKALFQGAAPVSPINLRGSIYPGDQEIGDKRRVRIQVHHLVLTAENGAVVVDEVPAVAVWMPKAIAQDIITQYQPFQNFDE